MSYTVTLQDFPNIPADLKQQAEHRFTRVLERSLGGADEIRPAYKAWSDAEDASEGDLSAEEKALAVRWQKAAMKARQEGFNGLGEVQEAYFEVRLAR